MSFFNEVRSDAPLSWWRFADAVENITNYRYNLAPNPSLETSGENWQSSTTGATNNKYSGNAGEPSNYFTAYRINEPANAYSGSWSVKANATTTHPNWGWVLFGASSVKTDRGYTISIYVKVTRAAKMGIQVDFIDSAGTYFQSASPNLAEMPLTDVPANTWTRLSRIITPPARTSFIRVAAGVNRFFLNDLVYADAALIEEGTVLNPYFDGSSSGAVWNGVSGNSTSTLSWVVQQRNFWDVDRAYKGVFTSTSTPQVAGYLGSANRAMQFAENAGSYAEAPASDLWRLGVAAGQAWSLEAVVRFDAASGGVIAYTADWTWKAFGTTVGVAPQGSGTWAQTAPSARVQNAWKHLVVTYDGTILSYYVDGALASAYSNPTEFAPTNGGVLRFGTTAVTLNEFAIYKRALPAARVLAHYQQIYNTDADHYVTSVQVSPGASNLIIGGEGEVLTQQLAVQLTYSDGTLEFPLPATLTWRSTDPAVATVSSTGLVSARQAGFVGISVSVSTARVQGLAGISVRRNQALDTTADYVFSVDSQRPILDDEDHLIATTGEYWEVDQGRLVNGQWVYDSPVSLATMGWNISTIDGREGIPESEGENIRVGGRAGRRWVPKVPDQRKLSLAMWVQGTDREGNLPVDVHIRTKFWDNFNMLKQLFGVYDRQLLMRRRVPSRSGIILQEAFVEIISDMDISPTGPFRGAFVVDVIMSDPYWYDATVYASDPVSVRGFASGRVYPRTYPLTYGEFGASGSYTLRNRGTHDAKLWAEFQGPLLNPTVYDVNSGEMFRLLPDVVIDSKTSILVDFYEKSILLEGTGSRYWWMDRRTDWLTARPGESTFQLSHEGSEQTGYVIWRWQPSYL